MKIMKKLTGNQRHGSIKADSQLNWLIKLYQYKEITETRSNMFALRLAYNSAKNHNMPFFRLNTCTT